MLLYPALGALIGSTLGATLAIVERSCPETAPENLENLSQFSAVGKNLQALFAISASGTGNPGLYELTQVRVSCAKIGAILKDSIENMPSSLSVVVARKNWEFGLQKLRDGVNKLFLSPENPSFSPQKVSKIRLDIEEEMNQAIALIHTKSLASPTTV